MAVYLHFEGGEREHTIKLDLRATDAPITVAQALAAFVDSCSTASPGFKLEASEMQLQTEKGRVLLPEWVLPCGEPPRSDLFVVRRHADLVTAKAINATHATGTTPADARDLTPAQLDAIRVSQARKGENSYYYSVNKNLGNTVAPPEPHVPRKVIPIAALGRGVREQTISSYTMVDGEHVVKVHVPLAGAKRLPANGISAGFFDRSFKLAIRPDASSELSLNVPLLCEPIDQHGCAIKVLEGKVVVVLAKRESHKDRVWYELRKTKGVGDTEYDKLVPWEGELVVVGAGGNGEALPPEAAPVCLPGPPARR